MNYKETGFRAIYKNFVAFPMRENYKEAVKDYPNIEKASFLLCYGYIDHEAGLTLEVLAGGSKSSKGFRFFDTNITAKAMIRIGAVGDDEFYYFADENDELKTRYKEKIDALSAYEVNKEIEKTRDMAFLDPCRHPEYPDDIQVYLVKDNLNTEICWTRITGLGEHWLMGELLNEPDQDFGYHIHESIAFFIQEKEDKTIICYSDMNPSRKLSAEDFENGDMLRSAIRAFENERTEEHLIDILEILRDSFVWVPCNAVIGEADQKKLEELIEKAGDRPDSLIGQELTNEDNIRLIPDVLQNGEDFFFPAFSNRDEMGEYGTHFSKVEKHFLEVINLARNNEKNIKGIVIDAFSNPFVVEMQIADVIEQMKSRIE